MRQPAPEDLDDIREVARRLRGVLDEIDDAALRMTAAEAAWKRARLEAHVSSTTLHPERRVAEHDTAADLAAFDLWATFNAAQTRWRALRERAHSERQILSAFQTVSRVMTEATR